MKVCKFGGTSLAGAEQIHKVSQIILSDPARRLVVVSAPGRRYPNDIKVTDLLIRCAEQYLSHGSCQKEQAAVVERYAELVEGLGLKTEMIDHIDADLRNRLKTDYRDAAHFVDTLKAAGEDHCARLMAAYLRHLGAEAHYVNPKEAGLLVSDEYGQARVLPEAYANLRALSERPGIMVFPGFFGYTPAGHLVTFPRGGSDITGSILAAAVQALVYENFTDVNCVYTVDPYIVPHAEPITELSYREMRELSYAGFSVFHYEALEPVVHAAIPVWIKNTNNPDTPGTRIVPKRNYNQAKVVGIASDQGFCSIYLGKYLMNREIGFGRRLLQILEEENISFEHMPSGIDDISIILRENQWYSEKEARVVERIRTELAVDNVSVEHGLTLIMVVGEGMRHTVGIAGQATTALARANVNLEMINQGSSEVSMMFGIKAEDTQRAVRALYQAFFDTQEHPLDTSELRSEATPF